MSRSGSTVQTQESQPKFRLTPQVIAIVVLVLLALALPIAGVILSVKRMLMPVQEEVVLPETDAKELREALIRISEKELPKALLESDRMSLSLDVNDLIAVQKQIEELAKQCRGIALITQQTEKNWQILVQVPESETGTFLKRLQAASGSEALQDMAKDSAEAKSHHGGLIEITLTQAP